MSWDNNNDDNKDPWGQRKNQRPEGPEDIEKALADLIKTVLSFVGLGFLFEAGGKGSKGGNGQDGRGRGRAVKRFVFGILPLLLVALYGVAGLYTLDQQERGVVLRFGALQPDLQQPGLRWNPPIVDRVTKVNVTRINNIRHEALMLTKDENIVSIIMSVQYLIASPANYVVSVRNPRQSLEHASESALRHMVGSASMDYVLTEGREQLAVDVEERIQRYMDNYQTGIRVVKVNIDDSQPPREVAAAFDDVQAAQEDNQRLINEASAHRESVIPNARGEGQKQIEQANAYKGRVIASAEGEADRFDQLLTEYSKAEDVTRTRLYLDALEGIFKRTSKIVIDVKGGNNLLYLPLDQLRAVHSPRGTGLSGAALSDPTGVEPPLDEALIRRITEAYEEADRRRSSGQSRRGGR